MLNNLSIVRMYPRNFSGLDASHCGASLLRGLGIRSFPILAVEGLNEFVVVFVFCVEVLCSLAVGKRNIMREVDESLAATRALLRCGKEESTASSLSVLSETCEGPGRSGLSRTVIALFLDTGPGLLRDCSKVGSVVDSSGATLARADDCRSLGLASL